ncbi:MAG: Uma2 family endonuclease [Phormidesmis sp.]
MSITITSEQIDLPPGSDVTLRHQTWADYEAIVESRRDNAAIKILFNAHTQEISIMAPMAGHGRRIDTLADLVKSLLRHQGRDWDSSHPMTLKKKPQAGAEPDVSFYIQNWQSISGKDRIDLSQDPPPDLAIEVDLTSLTGLDVYRVLAVPELWIYKQGVLKIYVLVEGDYQERLTSPTFPSVDVKNIFPQYTEQAWPTCSSMALREFNDWLKSR